jgi:uncharacterized MAPEG superfamily protein
MTTVLICLTITLFMPLILAFASVSFRFKQFGRIDAKTPRLQAGQLKDGGHRVIAAQKNAWEAVGLFVGSLFMAMMAGVQVEELAAPALLFTGARITHGMFYIADQASLRTLSFVIAAAGVVWIIVKAFSV